MHQYRVSYLDSQLIEHTLVIEAESHAAALDQIPVAWIYATVAYMG